MKSVREAAEAMMAVLGLDDTAIATRKAFLGFSDADIAPLLKLHEALCGLGPEFARNFYDHLLRFPETRRFIPDEATFTRLKQAQAEYFDQLTAGDYGPDYIRHRLRVGIAHQRIGLETQWYLGAYAKYLVDLLPEIFQRLEGEQERLAAIQSLIKIVLLDMGLAIDTYIHADRQAILALKEYAELVFSAIPDGLVVLASDLTVLSANRAFLERFDLRDTDVRGRPLPALIAAEGLEARLREVRDSSVTLRDLPFEMGLVGAQQHMPVRITLTGIRLAEEEEEEEARLLMIVEDMTEQARLQQALEESEATLLRAQAVAHIGSWRLDFASGKLSWSPEVYRIFGLDPDAPIGYEVFLACVHPDDREKVDAAWQAALKGAPYGIEHRVKVGGETRWVEDRAKIEFDDDGQPRKVVGTVQDITERKRAEEWKQHYMQTLDFLMTGAPLPEVLEGIAVFAERQGEGALCSILLLSADGKHLVHGAAPSLPEFYNRAIDGLAIGEGVGSCGTAAFTGRTVIVEDVLTHPYWANYYDFAARAGLRACWSEPVLSADDKVLGTFALYHREPCAPTPEEMALIRQAARLAAIAIERTRQQEDLRLAAVVFEQSVEGIMVTDAAERILMVNRAFTELTGYTPAEVIGQTPSILNSGRHDAAFFQALRRSLEAEGRWQGEIWNRHKSGEVRPFWMSIATVRDAKGAVSHHISILVDICEQKAQAAKIEQLAFYDPLTELPNRALFMDRLHHELAAAERRNQRLSLLFLDLDRFKEINDTLGHDAGDRVLVEVARRFRQALREEETLARLSGDEFVIIASDSGEAATRIADRIAETLSAPVVEGHQGYTVSASIGIAVFPEDGRTPEELLKHADIAMYRAKGSGGGYRFYRAEMGVELARRVEIAHRLEAVLKRGQLQLYYQPQVHLGSGRIVGAEALARWFDAEWGMVSPAKFISIAEERGLIGSLGEWALGEACRQVRRWQENGRPLPGRVAVNVAARQFEDDDFIERVLRIPYEAGVEPSVIELELTESGMMRDPERAVEITRALASAGFALAIDDFGAGYSSLAYLKRFPVHKLKIDISFVRDMLSNRNDYAIVSTIIAMAKNLEMETLAEGVERADQADALLTLGCQLAQGFHFGRPEAAEDFARRWLTGA